jgi:hypothetical protein
MPCSPAKINRRFGGTCHLHFQSRRISQVRNQHEADIKKDIRSGLLLGFSSTIKMEATSTSANVVDFQRTAWCYIPEGTILHNHRCENLKPYILNDIFYRIQRARTVKYWQLK